jgi:hypothetical protein
MGFLDDLKKAADSAGQAVQRQVDNLQKSSPPAAPEPPPLDGSPVTASAEPPAASAPPSLPEVLPPTIPQPLAPATPPPAEADGATPSAFPVPVESVGFVPPPPPPS